MLPSTSAARAAAASPVFESSRLAAVPAPRRAMRPRRPRRPVGTARSSFFMRPHHRGCRERIGPDDRPDDRPDDPPDGGVVTGPPAGDPGSMLPALLYPDLVPPPGWTYRPEGSQIRLGPPAGRPEAAIVIGPLVGRHERLPPPE